jgi:DNA-binding NtrC family response regulator
VCRRYGQKPPSIPADGQARLRAYRWPGNVRELAHELERAVVFGGERGLAFAHLGLANGSNADATADWLRSGFVFPEDGFSLEKAIDQLVAQAVRQANGNISAAARLLGVSRDVVRYRLKSGGDAT